MLNHLAKFMNSSRSNLVYPLIVIITVIASYYMPNSNCVLLCSAVGLSIMFLFSARPNSRLYQASAPLDTLWKKIVTCMIALIVIIGCTFPMGLIDKWNGINPEHRNQYELITESFLDGHLDFDYGDEQCMEQLENPYDPTAREGLTYHWDHAFYKGHYYMYFGVVPVFLAFMPYRLITGQPLTTYHATQLFTISIIVGIFCLFYRLTILFFKKLPFIVYLALSASFSIASVWYSIAEPSLYCTAITAAIALEIWSIYFYIYAVWVEKRENFQIAYSALAALLGALVFGCRPPIAFANLLVIPILLKFIKEHKFSPKLLGKILLAASPYLFVAISLMLYNYARFDNPFEFGQRYQLTIADQRNLHISLNFETLLKSCKDIIKSLIGIKPLDANFPFITVQGALVNFPILLFILGILSKKVSAELKREKIWGLSWTIITTVIIIIILQSVNAPYLLERYHMDIYFLLFLLCFMIIGTAQKICCDKFTQRLNFCIIILSVLTVFMTYLFYVRILLTDGTVPI